MKQDFFDKVNWPNLKIYLRGVRNQHLLARFRKRPYNYYNAWASVFVAYAITKALHHYVFKTEYEMRKRPNPLIPKCVY